MEPENAGDYSKKSYWDARYAVEDSYDWFGSVYDSCLQYVFESIESVFHNSKPISQSGSNAKAEIESLSGSPKEIKVLHLGCGNSALCADIVRLWRNKYFPDKTGQGIQANFTEYQKFPYRILQVAVDYSSLLIEKKIKRYGQCICMCRNKFELSEKKKHACGSGYLHTAWVEADIRDLSSVRELYGQFDVVIDKGTMDSLQADKDNENMDSDVEQMLNEVSKCLEHHKFSGKSKESLGHGVFLQITWEMPYFRFVHTKREQFCWWGFEPEVRKFEESDMYRFYQYTVKASDGSS